MENLFIENGKAGKIWDFFLPKIGNLHGTAALLGCMYYASRFDPKCLRHSHMPLEFEMSESEYTDAVDAKRYSLTDFRSDGIEYGLMGWKIWYRKQSLYNRAALAEKSAGDLDIQLNYIWEELSGVTSSEILEALKNAENVDDAVEKLCKNFMELDNHRDENAMTLSKDYAKDYYTAFVENKSKLVPVSYVRILPKKAAVRRNATIAARRLRIALKDEEYQYLTTSRNGLWYSVYLEGHNQVGWIFKKHCSEIYEKMEKR